MDGILFLDTARFLRDNGTNEADYRTVISRAYYSCFLVARTIAFNNCSKTTRSRGGIRKEGSILHVPLQNYLTYASDQSIQQLGKDLASFHGNRKNADYELSKPITHGDADDAVEEAEVFIDSLQQISAQDIGQAMNDYISKTSTRNT